jgi:protein-disulfide isomerase
MNRLLRSRVALFAAVGVVAAGIAAGLIVTSVAGSGDDGKSSAPPTQTRPRASGGSPSSETGTTLAGAAETAALLKGIPQQLNVLGNPSAPVTMVEFADLQCPFCRAFAVDALPAIIREYVRPGKVKLVFGGMAFIGPDSETALRATYAAGLQGKLWNYLDLLYRQQGAENSGWVTDGLLRSVGSSIAGLDVDEVMAARTSPEVDAALAGASRQASSANVNRTPTFFAGPTGGTLQQLDVTALRPEAFRPSLNALLT